MARCTMLYVGKIGSLKCITIVPETTDKKEIGESEYIEIGFILEYFNYAAFLYPRDESKLQQKLYHNVMISVYYHCVYYHSVY